MSFRNLTRNNLSELPTRWAKPAGLGIISVLCMQYHRNGEHWPRFSGLQVEVTCGPSNSNWDQPLSNLLRHPDMASETEAERFDHIRIRSIPSMRATSTHEAPRYMCIALPRQGALKVHRIRRTGTSKRSVEAVASKETSRLPQSRHRDAPLCTKSTRRAPHGGWLKGGCHSPLSVTMPVA